jgi:hypothetical protein
MTDYRVTIGPVQQCPLTSLPWMDLMLIAAGVQSPAPSSLSTRNSLATGFPHAIETKGVH